MPIRGNNRSALLVLALFAGVVVIGLALRRTAWVEGFLILASGALLVLWTHQWFRAARPGPFFAGRRLPAGDCTLTPRQDASGEQLKQLGKALASWWQARGEAARRQGQWIDESALADLRAGELPQPFALRLLTEVNNSLPARRGRGRVGPEGRVTPRELDDALQQAREAYPQLDRLLPRIHSRAVQFFLGPQSPADLERVIDGLRRAIPEGAVEEVIVQGRSWDAPD
jgi:hypothetical protein